VNAASLLLVLLLVPVGGGAACLLARTPVAVLRVCCLTVLASLLVAVRPLLAALRGLPVATAADWLRLDALSAYRLGVMFLVFVLTTVYAHAYFRVEIGQGGFSLREARRFGLLWLGTLLAMTLTLLANNLGIMWVGLEATTLCTAFLICLHVTPTALEAMWKYLIMCSVGIAFAFLGTLFVGAAAEKAGLPADAALLWTALRAHADALDPALLRVAFLFLLVGYGTKAGLAPMHSWLPDAHSQAPAPVSALFSGFMLNAALYCLLRHVPLVEAATGGAGWSLRLLVLFGVLSILVAAVFIGFQEDGKRLLAYSSVEHLGIITLGFGLGGLGTVAALLHTLNHALGKTAAFLVVGRLGQAVGSHDLRKLTGMVRRAPFWGVAGLAAFLALMGMAPLAIFLSEFLVARAAAEGQAYVTLALFLAGVTIVFLGILRRVIDLAWGEGDALRVPVTRLEMLVVAGPLLALLGLGLWVPESLQAVIARVALVLGGAP